MPKRSYKNAPTYATSKYISFQEKVSYYFPELWKTKSFPRKIFVITNIPSKWVKLCKSEKENMELDRESTDIFKWNMIECYIHRPDRMFQKGCYALQKESVWLCFCLIILFNMILLVLVANIQSFSLKLTA